MKMLGQYECDPNHAVDELVVKYYSKLMFGGLTTCSLASKFFIDFEMLAFDIFIFIN